MKCHKWNVTNFQYDCVMHNASPVFDSSPSNSDTVYTSLNIWNSFHTKIGFKLFKKYEEWSLGQFIPSKSITGFSTNNKHMKCKTIKSAKLQLKRRSMTLGECIAISSMIKIRKIYSEFHETLPMAHKHIKVKWNRCCWKSNVCVKHMFSSIFESGFLCA